MSLLKSSSLQVQFAKETRMTTNFKIKDSLSEKWETTFDEESHRSSNDSMKIIMFKSLSISKETMLLSNVFVFNKEKLLTKSSWKSNLLMSLISMLALSHVFIIRAINCRLKDEFMIKLTKVIKEQESCQRNSTSNESDSVELILVEQLEFQKDIMTFAHSLWAKIKDI